MKKNLFNIILVFAFYVLAGCQSDLMDTKPYGSIGSENMWATENLCNKGVLGIYAQLRNAFVGQPNGGTSMGVYSVSEDGRDGTTPITGSSASSSSGLFSSYWQQHYEGISRANDAIQNLTNVPDNVISPETRGRLIAESKILRAYFYYRLNMVFKGVPIYLEVVDVSEYQRPRNTEAEVWNQILTDLTDAINESSLPAKYATGSADFGRVTKAVAYALRGKTYLWLKEWANAEADFKQVGTAGHALYTGSGAQSYKMLFKEANEQSPEAVWSVQNIGLSGYGNDFTRRYGHRNVIQTGGWATFIVNTDFVNTFEYADGTPFDWKKVFPDWDYETPAKNMVYFLRDNMTESEINTMTSRGADMKHYLPVGNEARIKAVYDKRDPRLLQGIITPYSAIPGGMTVGIDLVYTLRWPYRGFDAAEPYDLRTDVNARFHYLYRKFVMESTTEIPDRDYAPTDFPLIRYADVLLNLAEAQNEQNKTNEAVANVNLVRERAGIAPLNSNEATTVTGQADLRKRIQNERRWELCGEAVTFFDEMRWKTYGTSTKFTGTQGEGGGHKHIWGSFQYANSWGGDNYYTWPIPAVERERNANLTQNEGWQD